MSKEHCIVCDRKDPLMWHVRLPRNKITVPVCDKCTQKYKLYNLETTCLMDLLEPAISIGTTKNVNRTIHMLVDDILTEIDLDIHKVPSSDDFMQGTIKGLIRAAGHISEKSIKYIKEEGS